MTQNVLVISNKVVPLQSEILYASFQQRLNTSKGERIVGLVDDASGMLLLDLARSAGAHVHWTGQHVTHDGVSRHRVAVTDHSVKCIQQFAEFAQQCSRPTTMTEQSQIGRASCRERV